MERHYYGPPHGIPVESLSFTEVLSLLPKLSLLTSVQPRICSPRNENPVLVLKVQNWLFAHSLRPGLSHVMHKFRRDYLGFCHSYSTEYLRATLFRRTCDPGKWTRYATLDDEDGNCYCKACGMNVAVKREDYGRQGKGLVITRWLNLGGGLDRRDERRMTCFEVRCWDTFAKVPVSAQPRYLYGDSPECPIKEDPMMKRNAAYLRDKRYEKLMQPSSRPKWGENAFVTQSWLLLEEPQVEVPSSSMLIQQGRRE